MRLATRYLALSLGTWLVVLAGCQSHPVCAPGELRYRGRPPARLFAFETSCQNSCLSGPGDTSCWGNCGELKATSGAGAVWDIAGSQRGGAEYGRTLTVVDASSLGDDRALVFEFRYLDEAGGGEPSVWGFLSAGPDTYLADQRRGTARVSIRAGVAQDTDGDGIWELDESAGEVVAADGAVLDAFPARLDVLDVSDDRIRGNFYLAFETEREQPESEVIGCFDFSLATADEAGARVFGK